jgi:hypothetical protein
VYDYSVADVWQKLFSSPPTNPYLAIFCHFRSGFPHLLSMASVLALVEIQLRILRRRLHSECEGNLFGSKYITLPHQLNSVLKMSRMQCLNRNCQNPKTPDPSSKSTLKQKANQPLWKLQASVLHKTDTRPALPSPTSYDGSMAPLSQHRFSQNWSMTPIPKPFPLYVLSLLTIQSWLILTRT